MEDKELQESSESVTPPIQAIYEGDIQLADGAMPLNVAVLEDGTRLINRNAIFRAFGRTQRGRGKLDLRAQNLPTFVDAKNLISFISPKLQAILSNPIKCRTLGGRLIDGYRADVLPLLCDVYLDAQKAKALTTSQEPLAIAAFAIVRSLTKLGIIALIDEATGYQYERERDELQKILKLFVAEELRPWTKTFPDIFYREIFRLNDWDFTVNEIKKRPPIIGKWTNEYVYDQLPKGVLEELKRKTPKSPAGNYTARFFQSLTTDIGNPGLQAQINSVITLMQVSDYWSDFTARFKKLVQRRAGQLELGFDKEKPKDIEPPKPRPRPKPTNEFDAGLKGLLDIPPPPKPEKRKKPKPPKDDEADGESAAELVPA